MSSGISPSSDRPAPFVDPPEFSEYRKQHAENTLRVKEYLLSSEPIFVELMRLRTLGWESKDEGDAHFRNLKQVADSSITSLKQQRLYFNMQKAIGREMESATTIYSDHQSQLINVLDLCMAPGGFTHQTLFVKRLATVDGITLPPRDGGHKVLVDYGKRNPRVQIDFADITMFCTEFGTSMKDIPTDHPDAELFSDRRPYLDRKYELVFCDGQVLRRDVHPRRGHREPFEAARLTLSQLILGFQRIQPGGTMVVLLHRLEAWDTLLLVRKFATFSDVRTFKPKNAHGARSSFYMIAKNVRANSETCLQVVADMKRKWYSWTFENGRYEDHGEESVEELLRDFGETLRDLGRDLWRIQAKRLGQQPFVKTAERRQNVVSVASTMDMDDGGIQLGVEQ